MPEIPDLAGRSRDELAVLLREYLLGGHLIDRAGMPHVIGPHGREVMGEIAIDEWMGASPIYTARMQRALGFGSGDVETMFKNLQLDIGSPPQFMDFRFQVDDADHGAFWLDSCGALLDVEPMGDEFVHTMCHTIEDPTFDATATAVNPRARVRPLHRPPRVPADRTPHCHWTVTIDPADDPIAVPEAAERIARTAAAAVVIDRPEPRPGDDGWTDYDRPLVEDLPYEWLSADTLQLVCEEVCLQGQLLVLAFLDAIERRFGADEAAAAGRKQMIGAAGLVADRLRRALDLDRSLDAIAEVVRLHPALRPRAYVDLSALVDGDHVVVAIAPGPALEERSPWSWPALLRVDDPAPLDAIVQAVDPTARCEPADVAGAALAWTVTTGHEPAKEPDEVMMTRFSTGADFTFETRVPTPIR
ncbi:MAG: hypothetical protein U0Q07_00840 [Acidimicrobiales bacterium]